MQKGIGNAKGSLIMSNLFSFQHGSRGKEDRVDIFGFAALFDDLLNYLFG